MAVRIATRVRPLGLVLDGDGHTLALAKRLLVEPIDPRFQRGLTRHRSPAMEAGSMSCQVQSAADLNAMLTSTATIFGSIGIIDFGSEGISTRVLGILSQMLAASDLVRQSKLIAIGSPWIGSIERELQLCGFALVVRSKSEALRIGSAARRYWQTLKWPSQSIEGTIARNYPWSPID